SLFQGRLEIVSGQASRSEDAQVLLRLNELDQGACVVVALETELARVAVDVQSAIGPILRTNLRDGQQGTPADTRVLVVEQFQQFRQHRFAETCQGSGSQLARFVIPGQRLQQGGCGRESGFTHLGQGQDGAAPQSEVTMNDRRLKFRDRGSADAGQGKTRL